MIQSHIFSLRKLNGTGTLYRQANTKTNSTSFGRTQRSGACKLTTRGVLGRQSCNFLLNLKNNIIFSTEINGIQCVYINICFCLHVF